MIDIYMPDTDLGQICDSGQTFRMYKLPEEAPGICDEKNEFENYEIYAGNRYVKLHQNEGHIIFECDRSEYDMFWKNYFDADTDYGYIKSLVDGKDTYLKKAVEFGSGIRILKQDLWEMIVTFLISQQNNIPRIRKCIENICAAYGEPIPGAKRLAFPGAESLARLDEDALMECNLGYRSKYVVRTAGDIVDGKFDLNKIKSMSYEEAREELLKMYGIGNKVADCICLFALHHIDAFPIDTHIKQILNREYPEGFPFEKYRGYLGIIQQYMFFAEVNDKK